MSNQFNFIGLRSCKDCYKRQSGVVGACGKANLCVSFYVGQFVLGECVVGGGGLDRSFGEQGPPVGVQECLDGFHRRCVDYLSRQLVPKWESPIGERELTTAGAWNLLMELISVVA